MDTRRAERALGPTLALGDITNAESILLRAVPVSAAFGGWHIEAAPANGTIRQAGCIWQR